MKKSIFAVLLLAGFVAHMGASSAARGSDEIQSVEIQEVAPTDIEMLLLNDGFERSSSLVAPISVSDIDLDQIIRIGKLVVEIIKGGAPVIDVREDAVNALPKGISRWENLAGWRAPVTRIFQLVAKNTYGIEVVNVRLQLSANYGGHYYGSGKYLSNIHVVPTSIFLAWGYNLDIWMVSHDPVNIGTRSRPIAGMGVDLNYRITTALPLTHHQGARQYFLTGDGRMNTVN